MLVWWPTGQFHVGGLIRALIETEWRVLVAH